MSARSCLHLALQTVILDVAAQDAGGPVGVVLAIMHPEQVIEPCLDRRRIDGHLAPTEDALAVVLDGSLEDRLLLAATPGADLNWLEDVTLLEEDGTPAVFDRYSNSFLKIYFPIPAGREDEIARKVLIKHLQSGNSYGIALKERHCKFPQPELGPWVAGSQTVGTDYHPSVLEGWEPPAH